jgi:transcriptional regulator with XRE-family HTH domain
MAFYQRLRDLKEDANLTQKEVAAIIGVSVNHYGKYERGETDLPLEKALQLAEYYHVSLDYLAGRTNCKQGMAVPETPASLLFQRLSKENQARIEERMLEMLFNQKG